MASQACTHSSFRRGAVRGLATGNRHFTPQESEVVGDWTNSKTLSRIYEQAKQAGLGIYHNIATLDADIPDLPSPDREWKFDPTKPLSESLYSLIKFNHVGESDHLKFIPDPTAAPVEERNFDMVVRALAEGNEHEGVSGFGAVPEQKSNKKRGEAKGSVVAKEEGEEGAACTLKGRS